MVYLNKFKKRIIPNFVAPEKDELFSSWLFRNAFKHHVTIDNFTQSYIGNSLKIWRKDIDIQPTCDIITFCDQKTPLKRQDLISLFLISFEDNYYPSNKIYDTTRFFLPLTINNRTHINFGQQFCPRCLSKETTYYKKNWRLITSIVCEKCKCLLHDRCPNCNSPISFFKNNYGIKNNFASSKPIYYCSCCSFNLAKSSITKASQEDLEFQKFINDSIENGYNNLTQYSFTYIEVLLLIAQRVKGKYKKNNLNSLFNHLFRKEIKLNSIPIRNWSIDERIEILSLVNKFLTKKPDEIRALFNTYGIMRSHIVYHSSKTPYWFELLFQN